MGAGVAFMLFISPILVLVPRLIKAKQDPIANLFHVLSFFKAHKSLSLVYFLKEIQKN